MSNVYVVEVESVEDGSVNTVHMQGTSAKDAIMARLAELGREVNVIASRSRDEATALLSPVLVMSASLA